jgi:hypothetical protein
MAVTETVTQSGADAFTQPFLQYGMQEALKQYQQGAPAYFPGQTYTAFSPQTEQALVAQEQRALAGSPVNARRTAICSGCVVRFFLRI